MHIRNRKIFEAIFEVLYRHKELTVLELIESSIPFEVICPRYGIKYAELASPNAVAWSMERGITNKFVRMFDFDQLDLLGGIFSNNKVLNNVPVTSNQTIFLNKTGTGNQIFMP